MSKPESDAVIAGTATVNASCKFIDGGEDDPKLICIQSRFTEEDQACVIDFFERYAKLKRPLNQLRFKRGATEFRGFVARTDSAKMP